MQFSEKLKKLRAEKGVSQSELAEKIYVSRSAVAKWENGLGLPSGESLTLLAEFFGVEKNELVSDPETANVIIKKNHTLSKQKIWIITLVALSCVLIAVAAVLIPLALRQPEPIPAEPPFVPTRELIFESEKDIADLDAINYSDDAISTDKYFAPSRIFTYTSSKTTIILPRVFIKTQISKDIAYYQYADEITSTVSENCTVGYNSTSLTLYVLATDAPYSEKNEYCINLAVEDMRLSFKIRQEPIPVESITIKLESEEPDAVTVETDTVISTTVSPSYATYSSLKYTIDKIVNPDGILYSGTYSQYASVSVSDKVYLHTTRKIDVGAKIYIYAIAERDQVRSNVLEVEIVRIPIKDMTLNTDKPDVLQYGTMCWFRPVMQDEDATYNVIGEEFEVTLLTPELAELEYSRGIHTCFLTATSDKDKIGDVIAVLITTPEGFSKTFYWTIDGTPVEKVILVNADTGEELDRNITIAKGETMRFAIKTVPAYAYYTDTTFLYDFEYPEDITVSEDNGILTVTVAEDAIGGARHYIWGRVYTVSSPSNGFNSSSYVLKVEKTILEGITLAADGELVKGQYTGFTFEYSPYNADVSLDGMKVYMLDEITGVKVISGAIDRAFTDYTAIGGTEVKFRAVYNTINGLVESNILTLTVQNVSVTSVALGIQTLKVKQGNFYPLILRYNRSADPEAVEYKLLDQVEGVYIMGDNLVVLPEAIIGTKFSVQAVVDGFESNILNLEIVESADPEEIIELAKSTHYWLNKIYYPDVEGSVLFILLDEIDEVELVLVNKLYGEEMSSSDPNFNFLNLYSSARTDRVFRVMSIVDGVADRVFTFKIVDTPQIQTTSATHTVQAEEFKKKHGC